MEFGRVTEKELEKVDFSLPRDPVKNKMVLKGKPVKKPKVYLGCAKWGRKEWVGKIYPLKTREKDFLRLYAHHYNSIELNATHYKVYGAKGIEKWKDMVGRSDFIFCPKMYKGITHFGKLSGKKFITNEFLRRVNAFAENLGPIFIQVAENFTPKRMEELQGFLASLPAGYQFFLEVRHPAWFSDKKVFDEMTAFIRKHKIGWVITDTAGRRDCAHMSVTLPRTFIRYVGNSLHPTDYTRVDAWVKRIKSWLDAGMKEVYFFMHMHDEATSPELTIYLVDKLNKVCGLDLKKPTFL